VVSMRSWSPAFISAVIKSGYGRTCHHCAQEQSRNNGTRKETRFFIREFGIKWITRYMLTRYPVIECILAISDSQYKTRWANQGRAAWKGACSPARWHWSRLGWLCNDQSRPGDGGYYPTAWISWIVRLSGALRLSEARSFCETKGPRKKGPFFYV